MLRLQNHQFNTAHSEDSPQDNPRTFKQEVIKEVGETQFGFRPCSGKREGIFSFRYWTGYYE